MDYILMSGGLDSVVLAAYLHDRGTELTAVYVNHGQLGSRKELVCSDLICDRLGIPLKVIDISGTWCSFQDVLDGRPGTGTSAAIALNAGILHAINWIAWAGGKKIYVGIHKDDLTGRPWIIDLFAKYMEGVSLIRPSLTGIPPRGNEFQGMSLEFPFKDLMKHEIIDFGHRLQLDLTKTMSCQYDADAHCGKCYICDMRRDAFSKSAIPDPTPYKTP